MTATATLPLQTKTPARSSAAPALLGLMLAQLLLFFATFFVLSSAIGWPDSLDGSAAQTLPLIQAQWPWVALGYGAFLLDSLLLIPITVLARRVMQEHGWDGPAVQASVAFGVLGGVLKILGIVRWFAVMPMLATLYQNAEPGSSTRETVSVVFEGFNAYAGGIGESLGDLLFPGIWTLLVAVALLRRIPWLGWSGLAVAMAMIVGGATNLLALPLGELLLSSGTTAWGLWCVALGVGLWRSRRAAGSNER